MEFHPACIHTGVQRFERTLMHISRGYALLSLSRSLQLSSNQCSSPQILAASVSLNSDLSFQLTEITRLCMVLPPCTMVEKMLLGKKLGYTSYSLVYFLSWITVILPVVQCSTTLVFSSLASFLDIYSKKASPVTTTHLWTQKEVSMQASEGAVCLS